MKLLVISAHEGSVAFRGWINSFKGDIRKVDFLTVLSDVNYRSVRRYSRFFNRVTIYFIFPLVMLLSRRRVNKADVIFVVTSPFYAPWLARLFYPKKKVVILHNDIYPEAFKAILGLKETGVLFRGVMQIDQYFERKVDGNVYISKEHYDVRKDRSAAPIYLPTPGFQTDLRKSSEIDPKFIRFVYSGTLNSLHWGERTKTLLVTLAGHPEVIIDFYISGSMRNQVASELTGISNVNFYSPLGIDQYVRNLLSYDYGLVMLNESSASSIFPSKIPGHLSIGQPVLVLSPTKNSVTDFIAENSCGDVFIGDQASKINVIANHGPKRYAELCENSTRAFEENFCPDMLSKKLTHYLVENIA
ncbi:hypothetical protein N9P68_00250 [Pseudomonadales bacterium]|nr:hypothetical protein [Pseudomonadales bacterium]